MSDSPTVDRVIRREIREMRAYHVAEAGGMIKLDAMENPYDWPAGLAERVGEAVPELALNRYPDPAAREVRALLYEAEQIPGDLDIVVGNGSDELIQLLCLAAGGAGRAILSPSPSFAMYEICARISGSRYLRVPLTGDFALDTDAMLGMIGREQPALVFLAWPNNPTANLFDRGAVEAVVKAAPGLVVIDEAYRAFARQSLVDWAARYPNVVIMRTLSKLGMAGLRFGFLACTRQWAGEFEKLRLPYNIDSLTQRAVSLALAGHREFDEQARTLIANRERLGAGLDRQAGVRVYPSDTNFFLVRCESASAGAVHAELIRRGILVKNLDGADPMLDNCLRISVGREEEVDQFLEGFAGAVESATGATGAQAAGRP